MPAPVGTVSATAAETGDCLVTLVTRIPHSAGMRRFKLLASGNRLLSSFTLLPILYPRVSTSMYILANTLESRVYKGGDELYNATMVNFYFGSNLC